MTRRELVERISGDLDAALASGVGSAIRLVGEAGIGKSTIVGELAERARPRSASIWTGQARELDGRRPLASLSSVRSGAGELLVAESAVDAAVQRGAGGQLPTAEVERFATIERVVERVEFIAQRPAVVVLEDIHWADALSLEALLACVEATLTHPLVVVMTQRPDRADAAMSHFDAGLAALGIPMTPVPPLAADEVGELLEALCGGHPAPALVERARGAGGNPFLLREYVDGLLASGTLIPDAAGLDAATPGIPTTLRSAMREQLRQLGDDVSDVLRAASVQGASINVGDLAALLGRQPISLAVPIERAVRASILQERGAELEFRHDLVRQAVYEQMPVALRMATHRQLAEVLSQRGARPSLIGSHLVLGTDNGDNEAIRRLREAAADVALVDPDTALSFLDRARTFASSDVATLLVIERARMEALTGAGRLAEADSVARWLLDASSPDQHAELWARVGGIATLEGDSDRALEALETAALQEMNDVERSQLLGLTSLTSAIALDYPRAWTAAEAAIELGDRVDDPVGRSIGRSIIARMSTFTNSIEEGLKLGALSVSIADTDPSGFSHLFVPCLQYGMTAFDGDRLDIAEQMAARGFELADQYGMLWSRPLFGALAAGCLFRRGAIDLAMAEAETSVELARRTSSRQALTWAQSVCALVSVELGEHDAARRWSDDADAAEASGRSPLGVDHSAWARGRVRAATGDVDEAVAVLRAAWSDFEANGIPFCQPLIAPDLGRLASMQGDTDLLAMVATRLSEAAAASGVPALAAHAGLLRALRDGDAASARRSLADLERSERTLEVADWLVFAPDLVAKDPLDALHRALAAYERVGAVGSAARVRADLDGRGAKARPALDGWAALTPTEAAIAELLSQGLTNAQIARKRGSSRRTVESHLGRVYQKLRIDGRVALTVAATERFRPS